MRLKTAKAEYLVKQLNSCKDDSAKFWRTIQTVFPNGKLKDGKDIQLMKSDELLGSGEVANYINEFFINVGNTTLSKTPNTCNATEEVTQNLTRKLRINNAEIQRTDKYTYLGVVLDERMSFELHAKNVINRVSTKVYQLKKVRKFLSKRAALMVYKNMILSIVEYWDIYLYSATKDSRKKLQTMQNIALRCALLKDSRYNTTDLHAEAKL